MQFLKSKLLLSLLIISPLFAQTNILSPLNQSIIDLEKEKSEESKKKLQKDWLNPILYKYIQTYSDSSDTTKSVLSISQPIFKSGGIYNAIKYASYLDVYNNINIEIQRKNLIKEATKIVFSLKKLDFTIKKQNLLITNAIIDINRKKEQVLNGFLDTSFLNNAIIIANQVKTVLVELEFQKEELINNLENISNKKYTQIKEPKFKLLEINEFLNNNIELEKYTANISVQKKFKDITLAKYLPSVNVFYDYTKYHDEGTSKNLKDGDTYGLNITVPLDFSASNDYQKEKIEYNLRKKDLILNEIKQKNLYKNIYLNINMIKKKSILAREDYELYDSLLIVIIEEKNAQIKTQSDVDTLANSQKIKALDIKIFEYEKQILLLELYSKIIKQKY